jgi:hypothetical protein
MSEARRTARRYDAATRRAFRQSVDVYAFTEAGTTSTGLSAFDVDGDATGKLTAGGVRVSMRRTEQGQTEVLFDIALTGDRDALDLQALRALAVVARGASTGRRYLVRATGVPFLTEPSMRFRAEGRVEAYELPAAAGNYLVTSGGDTLVTSGGDSLVWS